MATYAITGIQAGVTSDTVPLRLEVDSWYPGQTPTHLLQNNLFLWALHFLEIKDPDEKLSYFQIAGIHGSPFMPWDEDTDAQTANEGYCTHDSLLFPCWHRPYTLLFEQVLYEVMLNEVIPKLPQDKQQDWHDAATTFRLPYWDWAEKKERGGLDIYDIPMIAKDPRIEVVNLEDATTTVFINNPMYKFKMPDNERMGCSGVSDVQDTTSDGQKIVTIPFSKSRATSRWAPYDPESAEVSIQWENGTVDNQKISEALKNHDWYGPHDGREKLPLAEMVYRLFLPEYITSFTQFATTKCKDTDAPAPYLSLEFVHNNIHNWTGGMDSYMGHMTEPPVAAFDPIFYMHHCNVDRQFAIWQALNVDNKANWFQEGDEQLQDDGTWSIKTNTTDTPQTPLAPFHKDAQGTYFTSDDIKNWMQWGYSYPELQPWLEKYKKDGKFDKKLYIRDIQYQLKKLYSPADLENATADVIINVEYKRFALNGIPYTLYLFISPQDKLSQHHGPLHTHPDLVGFVYTFTNPVYRNRASPGCANCRRKSTEGTTSRAQVPITGALLARMPPSQDVASEAGTHGSHGLTSLKDPDAVARHLELNLHWRVMTHGGHDVPIPSNDPFLRVSVYHRSARFDDRTSRETYQHLQNATRGKPGGFPGHLG